MIKPIIWKDLSCQEITGQVGGFDIKCGRIPTKIIFKQKDAYNNNFVYIMCDDCARPHLKNRSASLLVQDDNNAEELKKEIERAKIQLIDAGAKPHPKLTRMIYLLLKDLNRSK